MTGLADLRQSLVSMALVVLAQVERGVRAWNEGDADLATRVAEDDAGVDERCAALEQQVLDLHQRWTAFGESARLLHVAVIAAVALERVGNLAVAIAECARGTTPSRAVPAVEERLGRMSEAAVDALHAAIAALATGDLARAAEAEADAGAVPVVFRELLDGIGREEREQGGGWLTAAILVGRHLERIAANAGELAGRARFVVTGARAGADGEPER